LGWDKGFENWVVESGEEETKLESNKLQEEQRNFKKGDIS
jgi:hypothetical protein